MLCLWLYFRINAIFMVVYQNLMLSLWCYARIESYLCGGILQFNVMFVLVFYNLNRTTHLVLNSEILTQT